MTKPEQKIPETDTQANDAQEPISDEVKKQAEAATSTQQLADLQVKLDEMKEAALRSAADAENTRKRAAKEIEEANKYGVTTFAKDIISVLENLQRALDATPEDQKKNAAVKTLFEGVDMTRKELLGIFERKGIKRIEPKAGEKFDHNLHQAIAQVEDFKFEPGAVIQVVQSGYIIHDRLLRPAMVTVSKGAPAQPRVDTTA